MLSMLGVPSSAGSYAAGQDQAPRALREVGLLDALQAAGIEVTDVGDLAEQIWAPDRHDPLAQNTGQVVSSVRELAGQLPALCSEHGRVLVLGGNCTIAVAVMAGLRAASSQRCGLLYVDRHFDMNTPATTIEGALDWMGLAHALDLPGCIDVFADALGQRPVVEPDQVAFLGTDLDTATDFEREQLARLAISNTPQADLIADPAAAAATALRTLPDGPLAVHVDVDVLNFTDAPLAENTSGRNIGPSLEQLATALRVAVADPRWQVLSIGEINPTRTAGEPAALTRLVTTLTRILSSHR